MFKRSNILSIVLAFVLILSNTIVFAQESLPEIQPDIMGGNFSVPVRNASSWALNELVDSDRYGLYNVEDLYTGDLRGLLDDEFKENLLIKFKEKLDSLNLETSEKPGFLAEVHNSNTRGDFLRQVYNVLILYENEENLGKDPIMYLNHIGIAAGNGKDLFLQRNTSVEEAILFVKRAVDYIYSENDLDSKGLMWKVENNGNTVYMLGSIHYGKPDLYPLNNNILQNFSDSDALYVEVDITNEEELMRIMIEKFSELEQEFETSSKFQDGTTLESVIEEDLYSKIKTIMNKHNIPEEDFVNFNIQGVEQKLNEIIIEKSFEDLSIEDEEAFEQTLEEAMEELSENEFMKLLIEGPKLGIDFYFLDKAKTLNKKIGELESIESQLELIFGGELFGDLGADLSEDEQVQALKEVLENFDSEGNIVELQKNEDEEFSEENFDAEMEEMLKEQEQLIEGMFQSIKDGNAEKLAKLFLESNGAEILGGQLIGERDKNMAKVIADLLQGEEGKTYFVVVGAAHFVVEGTILDNLINMGYKVERVK